MQKGMRKYEEFLNRGRENFLKKVEDAYEEFKETKTIRFPAWQYGEPKGKIIKLEVEDTPKFGQNAFIELDSARTAFISIDMQTDFAGEKGYVDVMGYDLAATSAPIKPIKNVLDTIRGTDIKVVHTREGHLPDLSDAPFNKVLRSKIIGHGVGIGETPEGGIGKLLTRGEPNWDIVDELYPIEGEYIVDKEGKGAFTMSNIHLLLKNLGVTHLVISGITTDVCVHTIMREANDYGYWCILLKDCTGATDEENYKSAIKSIKMQGGVFGNVSDSERFIKAVKEAGLK
ncbi:cysteine hydrolase family protein [Senegalia massiliensis]|uniref:cysteine hydrolase family protein n=1 Tax=Senegalia massiliensis TaxID=1720316 RepID=UPI001A935E97|nr:isochorismatase family cysteine hydrolase [Senegalia massiliensis]